MTYMQQVSQWKHIVLSFLPHLSLPQAAVLACGSLSMLLVGSAELTQNSALLALLPGGRKTVVANAYGWLAHATH